MFKIDLKNRQPIYEQIVDNFRRLIISGEFAPESKVPSVRDMAKNLNVNPNTVQKAYRDLENQGLFYTVLGQGSFIAEIPEDVHKQEVGKIYAKMESNIRELLYRKEEPENILKFVEHKLEGND